MRYACNFTWNHLGDINFCALLWKQAWLQSIVASDNKGHPGLLVFANAPFPFGCLLLGISRYSAGWFHVKLCAKWPLLNCCKLFLCQLQNMPITFLCCSSFQNKWHLAAATCNNSHPAHLKQNLEESFSVDWCRCYRVSMPHLFSISF